MNEEDKILLKRAKEGDIEAYEKLVEIYYKKVFNIALRMLVNYEDASDLAQEVFVRVYKSIGSFEEKSSFNTWIYRITTNLCMDEFRKRKNMKVVSFDEQIKYKDNEYNDENDNITPEKILLDNEMRDVLKQAIKSLPKDLRMAIILRDIQDFRYKEISDYLKCPQGTVKSRINRARQMLKKNLSTKRELFDDNFVKWNREE